MPYVGEFGLEAMGMIRRCGERDFEAIWSIINDGAEAYRGVVPATRLGDPYMGRETLAEEIADGVAFWGYEEEGALAGVMGIQQVMDVTLIRHAYVRTGAAGGGDRSQAAGAPARDGGRAGADWDMGRCGVGDPVLSAARVRGGYAAGEEAVEEVLEDTGAAGRDLGGAGRRALAGEVEWGVEVRSI